MKEAAWESCLEVDLLRTISGSPATADGGVGSSLLLELLLKLGAAFLAPPSQSSRVLREEIPTWERRRDWKTIRAWGRLLRA